MGMEKSKKTVIFFGDLLALAVSFFISLRIGYGNRFYSGVYETHLFPFLIIYLLWIILMFAFGLYESENARPTFRSIKNTFTAFVVAFLLSLSFFYIFPIFGITPKTNLFINISIFALFFILERRLITSVISKNYIEKIILIGEGLEIEELENSIEQNKDGYFKIIEKLPIFDQTALSSINKLQPDIVIFSVQNFNQVLLGKNLKNFLNSEIYFMDITTAFERLLGKIPSDKIDDLWFITNVYNFRGQALEIFKRIVETIFAIILLVILSPILLLIFIAIKIEDGGPFVYSQTRTGKSGQNFEILKIRSMITNSEVNGPEWAKDKDLRVTRVGKFLRSSHLDESLQLINIIRGDISMVGPRPERPVFVEELSENINNYNLRHIVKPGITGWAQINYKYGNSIADSKQKFEYDLYYIKNRSIFMDIGIVIRTVQKLFS